MSQAISNWAQKQGRGAMQAIEMESSRLAPAIRAEGNGNTFILVDYIEQGQHDPAEVRRAFGGQLETIDSCIVLERAAEQEEGLTLKIYVYEPGDGFCDNGARAIGHYLAKRYGGGQRRFIRSDTHVHELVEEDGVHYVEMGATSFVGTSLFARGLGEVQETGGVRLQGVRVGEATLVYAQTAEPHLVMVVESMTEGVAALERIGRAVNEEERYARHFPVGVNVNAVRLAGGAEHELEVVTFERGIKRITKACGTGVTSSCAVARLYGVRGVTVAGAEKMRVRVPGGTMVVQYREGRVLLGGTTHVEQLGGEREEDQ